MKRTLIVALVVGLNAMAAHAGGEPTSWTFDTDVIDSPPLGFAFGRTGTGAPGRWVVRAASGAPSAGNVLAQVDADSTDYRFPVAVADAPSATDGSLSVRCRMISGKVDQACGLVFRYQDENNYYIARANALEDNVTLYFVKDGRRKKLTGWNGKVTANAWHTLALNVRGNKLQVEWDGVKVIDTTDDTFADAGKVGVWTKADSVTEFDDLRLEPIGGKVN